jgi:hypothetical protein
MALRHWLTTLALTAAIAAPAGAQDRERHRSNDNRQAQQQGERARPRQQPQADQRRGEQAQQQQQRAQEQRAQQQRAQEQARRGDEARRQEQTRQAQPRAQQPRYDRAVPRVTPRPNDNRYNGRYDNRSYNNGRYDNRRWDNNRYESWVRGQRRYNAYVVRPQVVRVIPYRPYVYRPSFSIGVYYGSNGYYPYGYTPDYYFNPIPGHPYGGVRITGAPRDAQVFADGYYVGIVDDFDGIFQHMNLEAGPHHIEVAWGGYQPIAFDVYVRPGETTTFRADSYFRY